MDISIKNNPDTLLETGEARGFTRSMFELQALLLILVLLYFFMPTQAITNRQAMITTMIIYAAVVLSFRFLTLLPPSNCWKLALETWGMIAFITAILWHTGLVQSPLLNLYLLVIIACAITLGKIMTMLEVGLIASCYIYMAYLTYTTGDAAPPSLTILLAKFSPFMLVAYVTSILASDILTAKKKIALLSQTDELTGLFNMRTFNLMLGKEIVRAARHRQPFTIVMIDVDDLKSVNDLHGHQAGSRLLKIIAGSILDSIRTSDVLARYGGDEFIILMTQTSTEHASIIAERIRAAIHNTSFELHGSRVVTTVSIGIASFPDNVGTADAVFEKADVALYKSKQDGRDRVTFYERELESIAASA
ncbi:MAG: GGDEF domain-containing protein [Gammaproteobacteria bacterium]